jgi:hypothetical protein
LLFTYLALVPLLLPLLPTSMSHASSTLASRATLLILSSFALFLFFSHFCLMPLIH